MQCEVCGMRGSVGACAVCQKMVCEVCGQVCPRCGAVFCDRHQALDTPDGLCNRCAAKAGASEQPAHGTPPETRPAPEPAASGAQQPPQTNQEQEQESLSFEALMQDLGETPATETPPPTSAQPSAPAAAPAEEAAPPKPADPSKPWADMLDPNSTRVLTGSTKRATPMWVSSLFVGGMALIFSIPLALNDGFKPFQPMLSYSIMLLAVGAALWALYGMLSGSESGRGRKLCGIGLALSVLAILIAFATRNPGTGG